MQRKPTKKSTKKIYQVWMEESFADEIKRLADCRHQTFSEFVRATLAEKANDNFFNHILTTKRKVPRGNAIKEIATNVQAA
jgi:hypothetical protein